MKKLFLWMSAVIVACCFTATAFAACGDDEDDSMLTGIGEACVVAILPKSIAPYANLEVTYYDVQGNAKHFTVRNNESSDNVPSYAKNGLSKLELKLFYTIDYSNSIVRTVRFAVPADQTITCKYKIVLNGMTSDTYPSKAYAPIAVATGRRANSEVLDTQLSNSLGYKTFKTAEEFRKWLDVIKDKELESYVRMY